MLMKLLYIISSAIIDVKIIQFLNIINKFANGEYSYGN